MKVKKNKRVGRSRGTTRHMCTVLCRDIDTHYHVKVWNHLFCNNNNTIQTSNIFFTFEIVLAPKEKELNDAFSQYPTVLHYIE